VSVSTTYPVSGATSAPKATTKSPYDLTLPPGVQPPLTPTTPSLIPYPSGGVSAPTPTPDPAPGATPPPASPPPASTPPATPPPPPTGAPLPNYDYTADPILVQTHALSQQQVADAQAAAAAARKQALIRYGYEAGTPTTLYPDDATRQAAEQNPFSTLANLLNVHTQNQRSIDEGTNNANLFYSGEHARELGNESRNYLGSRASASDVLASLLGQADASVLAAQRAGQAQDLAAEEAAYQRAIDYALRYPGSTGGGGGGTTPPGTTPPGATPPGVPPGTPPAITPPPNTPPGAPPPEGYHTAGSAAGTPIYVANSVSPAVERLLVQYETDDLLGIRPGATRPGSALPDASALPTRTTTSSTSGAAPTTFSDPLATQATASGGATFALVRNSSSLPGNQAPTGVASAAMYNADDPLAAKNVAASDGKAGVWVPVHQGETAQQYADRVAQLAAANPAQIMLDFEGESKGYAGTAGYQFTQDVYKALAAKGIHLPISATVPGGGEDDFNYKPIVDSGGMVWIQCYGADASQLMDPKTRYDMMIARGVPPSQIGLMLMPGQQPIPGVPYSYYAVEDFNGNYPTTQTQQTYAYNAPSTATQAAVANALSSGNYSPQTQQAITQLVIQAILNPDPVPVLKPGSMF
jgi:hypothetical protein